MTDGLEKTERESSRGDFDQKLEWVLRCATTDLGLALREALRGMDARMLRDRVLALRDGDIGDPAREETAQVLACIAVESLAAPNEDPEATVERCLNPVWLRAAGVCMQSVSVRPGASVTSAQRALTSDLAVEDMGGGGLFIVWDCFATVARAVHLGWAHADNPLRTRHVSESEIGLLRSVPGADLGDGAATLDAREALRSRIDAAMAILSGDELELPSVEDELRSERGSGLVPRVNLLGSTVATPWSHSHEFEEPEDETQGRRRVVLWGGGGAVAVLVVLALWLAWKALNPPVDKTAGVLEGVGGSAIMAEGAPRGPAAGGSTAGEVAGLPDSPSSAGLDAGAGEAAAPSGEGAGEVAVAEAGVPSGEVHGEAAAPSAEGAAEPASADPPAEVATPAEGATDVAPMVEAPPPQGDQQEQVKAPEEPPVAPPDAAEPPVVPEVAVAAEPPVVPEVAVAAEPPAVPEVAVAAEPPAAPEVAAAAEPPAAAQETQRPAAVAGFKPTMQLSRLAKLYTGESGSAIKLREWPGGKALMGRCAVQPISSSQASFRIYQGYRLGRLLCTGDLGPFCDALGCPSGQPLCDVGMAWLTTCDH